MLVDILCSDWTTCDHSDHVTSHVLSCLNTRSPVDLFFFLKKILFVFHLFLTCVMLDIWIRPSLALNGKNISQHAGRQSMLGFVVLHQPGCSTNAVYSRLFSGQATAVEMAVNGDCHLVASSFSTSCSFAFLFPGIGGGGRNQCQRIIHSHFILIEQG